MSSSEAPERSCTALTRADQPTLSVRASVSAKGLPVKNTAAARRSSSASVRKYSASKPIFFSFEVVPAIASAVSAKRRISSFSLHQNFETLPHTAGKDQFLDLDEALHRCGITSNSKLFDFLEISETYQ